MSAVDQRSLSDTESDHLPKHHGARKVKGRGVTDVEMSDRYEGKSGVFETLESNDNSKKTGPIKSIEGWVIVVTGVHRDACEENIYNSFDKFGKIKCITLNLDRRTGFVCGFAFIEYEKYSEAKSAIDEMNGKDLLEEKIFVNWAFVRPTHNR